MVLDKLKIFFQPFLKDKEVKNSYNNVICLPPSISLDKEMRVKGSYIKGCKIMKPNLLNVDIYVLEDSLLINNPVSKVFYKYQNNELSVFSMPMNNPKFQINSLGVILISSYNEDNSFYLGDINGNWKRYLFNNKLIYSIAITNDSNVFIVLKNNDSYEFKKFNMNTEEFSDWMPYISSIPAIVDISDDILVVSQTFSRKLKWNKDSNNFIDTVITLNYELSIVSDTFDINIFSVELKNDLIMDIVINSNDYNKLINGGFLEEIPNIQLKQFQSGYIEVPDINNKKPIYYNDFGQNISPVDNGTTDIADIDGDHFFPRPVELENLNNHPLTNKGETIIY